MCEGRERWQKGGREGWWKEGGRERWWREGGRVGERNGGGKEGGREGGREGWWREGGREGGMACLGHIVQLHNPNSEVTGASCQARVGVVNREEGDGGGEAEEEAFRRALVRV